jgi:ribosomal protein S18 acetylase RimI-like enzyme
VPVQPTRNPALLRALFARDPIGAIYLLGDLEPGAFAHTEWWTAQDRAVVLHYTGLAVPVVLPFGDLDALAEILAAAELPASFYTKLDEPQRALFSAWRLSSPVELFVMGLGELAPVDPLPGLACELTADADRIAPLYDDYPGNFFDPTQVPGSLYALARLDGRVVAAAGAHAYAPAEAAAALGNVVTAATHRGRGVARRLVHFLCAAMRARGVRHIGLHVERVNAPAIACYRRLGFAVHSEITQFHAAR